MVYPYQNYIPFTAVPLMRSMVKALHSNIQSNSQAYLECSYMSWRGLGGDLPLTNIVHDSYSIHETVG